MQLGLIAGFGGTQRLPRLVGRGIATEMLLTGERISAQRAYEIGLVNRVVPQADLLETARQFVLTIASKAPSMNDSSVSRSSLAAALKLPRR